MVLRQEPEINTIDDFHTHLMYIKSTLIESDDIEQAKKSFFSVSPISIDQNTKCRDNNDVEYVCHFLLEFDVQVNEKRSSHSKG